MKVPASIVAVLAFGLTTAEVSHSGSALPPAAEVTAAKSGDGPPRILRLSVRSAEIQDVLRLIATQTGLHMSIGPEVVGRVSLSLGEMPVEEALHMVLDSHGFSFEKRGTAYIVRRARPIDPAVPAVTLESVDGQELLTLSARNSDLRTVLAEISRQWKRNIVPEPSVTGAVTLQLTRTPLRIALDILTASYGLKLEEREGFVLLTRPAAEVRPPAGPLLDIAVTDGLLSLDLREADVRETLLQIAQKAGLTFVLTPQVKDLKLTLRFERLPVLDGVRLLAAANDLSLEKVGPAWAIDKLPAPPTIGMPRPPSSMQRSKFANIKLSFEGNKRLVSINVEDADLGDVLKEISLQTGIELVAVGAVTDKVTLRLNERPIDEVLRVMLAGTKYSFTKIKAEELVPPRPPAEPGAPRPGEGGGEANGANAAPAAPAPATGPVGAERQIYLIGDGSPNSLSARALTFTEVIPLRFLIADDLTRFTSAPPTALKAMKEQNAIAVTGTRELIEKTKQEIAQLDRPGQQVMLEALAVEMSTTASRTFGLTMQASQPSLRVSTPDTTITFTTPGNLGQQITTTLQALIKDGRARVIANPRISTISGKQARIDIGETRFFRSVNIPGGGLAGQPLGGALVPVFTVERVQVGVILRMTPTVGHAPEGTEPEILLDMQPEVSSISGVSPEGLPEVSRRQAESTLRVKDGQSAIIGGLRQKEFSKSVSRVPVLSEIPFLGKLFRNTTRQERESELIIIVTPRVIKPGESFDASRLPQAPGVIENQRKP